jgi:hypothetical protein
VRIIYILCLACYDDTDIYFTCFDFIEQIVVEGDEGNPTECITQYPLTDTADNSGMLFSSWLDRSTVNM